jgi:hypothetical protein
MSNENLKEAFDQDQEVPVIEAFVFRDGKRSRGRGFVVVPTISSANTLLRTGGPEVEGKKIRVLHFNPKRQHATNRDRE